MSYTHYSDHRLHHRRGKGLYILSWFIGLCMLVPYFCVGATYTVGPTTSYDYQTITEALAAAVSGDIILVAEGTYNEASGESFPLVMKEGVILKRADELTTPVIEGNGTQSVFLGQNIAASSVWEVTTWIEGFRITNGGGYLHESVRKGGAIFLLNANVGFVWCELVNNSAEQGGAVAAEQDSNPFFVNCRLQNNQADDGGAFYCRQSSPMVLGGVMENNTATNQGGALFCGDNAGPRLVLSRIQNNTADEGGAMYCEQTSEEGLILGCSLDHNTASKGGGVYCDNAVLTFSNCLIHHNNGTSEGGGIYLDQATSIFNNCIICDNDSSQGGGIYSYLSLAVVNSCIIWGNQSDAIYSLVGPLVSYSCVEGDFLGLEILDENPQFVDAANDDYELQDCSPCIDAGSSEALFDDLCQPPGKGSSRNDMGAYGGPLNCIMLAEDDIDEIYLSNFWGFEGEHEGWVYRTFTPSPLHHEHWQHASSYEDAHAIGISSPVDESTNYFGLWDNLESTSLIPYEEDELYLALWHFATTSVDPAHLPSLRFRMGLSNQKGFAYSRIYSGDWLELAQRPLLSEFPLLFAPPIAADELFLAFSLIDWRDDFRGPTSGQIVLEEVTVARMNRDLVEHLMALGELVNIEGADFDSWTSSAIPAYDAPDFIRETDHSLTLSSGVGASPVFGSWDSPAGVFTLQPYSLYQLRVRLSGSSQLGAPQLRIRVHTNDFRYSWYTHYIGSWDAADAATPAPGGTDYYLYLISTNEVAMTGRLSFDLIDFSDAEGGSFTLEEIDILSLSEELF